MGIVWETYHKGVPLLGVPENPTEISWFPFIDGWYFLRPSDDILHL